MVVRNFFSLSFALLFAGGECAAWAQSAGSWIDPPAQLPPSSGSQHADEASPVSPVPRPSPNEFQADPRRADSQRPDRVPPTGSAEPSRRAVPVPPPEIATRRPPERKGTAEIEAAEALAKAYLNTWSAPNGLTLKSTTGFYAPRVRFHGRMMSARALLEEKRRFVRRWPERSYRPRLSTMDTACASRRRICTVRSVFDFAAANPASGRRSEGIGTLELVVSFAGERPVIAAENSAVLGRVRGG